MNTDGADFRGLNLKIICVNPSKSAFIRILFLLLLPAIAVSQDLPDKIRGYKVHRAKISTQNQTNQTKSNEDSDAIIKLSDPEATDVSLSGITFEISAEISPLRQGGTIDFLTFKDFRINGLSVDIEEYKTSFEVEKNKSVKLPLPIKIHLSFTQAMRGALKEWRESKETWQVSGRVFVFGRFKKLGFKFKRVIPIDVNLNIKNPLKTSQKI